MVYKLACFLLFLARFLKKSGSRKGNTHHSEYLKQREYTTWGPGCTDGAQAEKPNRGTQGNPEFGKKVNGELNSPLGGMDKGRRWLWPSGEAGITLQ